MSGNTRSSTATRERSWEFIAIPTVFCLLGILAVIMLAASSGLVAWLALGVIFLTVLVAVALVTMRRPHHPPRWSADDAAAHVDDGVHRVLLIADEACAPENLGAAIAAHHGDADRTAVFVMAPALGSRTARWTGDEHAYTNARQHLGETLEALADLQIDADGQVGSHDPLQTADDGLREFAADEVVFAVHPSGDANWLESGVVDAARNRYPIPVSELVVERTP